jgi:hypothetical protein
VSFIFKSRLKAGIIEELEGQPEVWKTFRKFKYEPEIPTSNSPNLTMRPQTLVVEEEDETPQSFQTPSEEQQRDKRWEENLTRIGLEKCGHMSYREKGIVEK